jgi:hypothetical protein
MDKLEKDLRAQLAQAERDITRLTTLLHNERGEHVDLAQRHADVKQDLARLRKELERERIRLAACTQAALDNTDDAIKERRLSQDNEYWSATYGDVCAAVDREIALRQENARLREEKESLTNLWNDANKDVLSLERENATLRQRVGELERASRIWEQTAKQMEANYEAYGAFIQALPKVEGEIRVGQPQHSFYYVVQDPMNECGAFLSQERARAYAALLRLRQAME